MAERGERRSAPEDVIVLRLTEREKNRIVRASAAAGVEHPARWCREQLMAIVESQERGGKRRVDK